MADRSSGTTGTPMTTSSHAHAFEPLPLEVGLYRCECGTEARRRLSTGELRVLKKRYVRSVDRRTSVRTGTSSKKPNLDQQEKRVRMPWE